MNETDRYFVDSICTSIGWYNLVAELTELERSNFFRDPASAEQVAIALCKTGESWPTLVRDRKLESLITNAK